MGSAPRKVFLHFNESMNHKHKSMNHKHNLSKSQIEILPQVRHTQYHSAEVTILSTKQKCMLASCPDLWVNCFVFYYFHCTMCMKSFVHSKPDPGILIHHAASNRRMTCVWREKKFYCCSYFVCSLTASSLRENCRKSKNLLACGFSEQLGVPYEPRDCLLWIHRKRHLGGISDNTKEHSARTNLRSSPFSHFALSTVLDSGQVVDSSVLQHRQENEDEADPEVYVHCFDVGHPGHGRIHSSNDGGHGQHCGDAWTQ